MEQTFRAFRAIAWLLGVALMIVGLITIVLPVAIYYLGEQLAI
jgi:hypothetical protein